MSEEIIFSRKVKHLQLYILIYFCTNKCIVWFWGVICEKLNAFVYELQKYDELKQLFSQQIEKYPEKPDYYYGLARVLDFEGKKPQVTEMYFKKAIQLSKGKVSEFISEYCVISCHLVVHHVDHLTKSMH